MLTELTQTEREYIEKLIGKIGRQRIREQRCYHNAQQMMFADQEKRLLYWEKGHPIPHAWVTINGKVVDVTLDAMNRQLQHQGFPPLSSDFDYSTGVMINRRRVCEHVLSQQVWGPVLPWDDISHETTPLGETVDAKRSQRLAQRLLRSGSKALWAKLVRNSRYRTLTSIYAMRFGVDLNQVEESAVIRAIKKEFRVELKEVGDLATVTSEQFKTLQNRCLAERAAPSGLAFLGSASSRRTRDRLCET